MDKLNDDIRRLTQENKAAFATRMNLEAAKNKLENLLTNNLIRRKDELIQVRVIFCTRVYCMEIFIILCKTILHLYLFGLF